MPALSAPAPAARPRQQSPHRICRDARRGREAAALVLFALSLFLALSLSSFRFDPQDPGLSGSDWMGPVGGAVAHFLAQGFGLVAWLVPLELSVVGAPLIRGRPTASVAERVVGDIVVGIIVASLVHIAAPELPVFGRGPAGGNVGLLFGELMRALFSAPGSFLVGMTTVGLILIGRSSFSFISACRRTAGLASIAGFRTWSFVQRLFKAWREARALRREQKRASLDESAPRIETRPSDEAIIAQIADDTEWIPIEKTGTPPLSLASTLEKLKPRPSPSLLETSPAPAAPAPVPEPVDSAGQEPPPNAHVSPQKAGREAKDDAGASGPRIVDTQPNRKVERARSKRKTEGVATFHLPATDLLQPPPPATSQIDRELLYEQAARLEKTLARLRRQRQGRGDPSRARPSRRSRSRPAPARRSPRSPASPTISRSASSRKVRIVAPIPGKNRIGFEIPNDERVPVNLRELVEDQRFEKLAEKAPLPVVLGRDIVGAPFYADLASMPHVIVAGATGAGKSVGLNVMLSSLLFRRTPDELRLLMIDPKVVELAPFDGIPHMLLPVVTDMKQAANALQVGGRRDGAPLPALRQRRHEEHHHLQRLGRARGARRDARAAPEQVAGARRRRGDGRRSPPLKRRERRAALARASCRTS